MKQLDIFSCDPSHYLYDEIQKMRSSMDRRSRAIFSIISEMQDQIISLNEKVKKDDPSK